MENKIKYKHRKEIALVVQLEIDFVSSVIKKFDEYQSMHKVLRDLKLNNEPLPESQKELQQLFMMNASVRQDNKKFKYAQYKKVQLSLILAHQSPRDPPSQENPRPRLLLVIKPLNPILFYLCPVIIIVDNYMRIVVPKVVNINNPIEF